MRKTAVAISLAIVIGGSPVLASAADRLAELEQAFETQQKSLLQLQQEMNRLRQDRAAQEDEMGRRVMEVEKKAAEAAASSLNTGYEPGRGFFLKSGDGHFQLSLRGYTQTWFITEGSRREEEFGGTAADKAAGLARHKPSTFRERRTRLIVSGQVFNDFGFYIEPDINGNSRLQQGWVNYTPAPWVKVTVGQYKPRFGLEMLTSARDLDFAERAVISRALSPNQQLGATIEGNLNLLEMLPVYYGVGIYNGCGRIDQCPGGIDNDGDKEFTGRVAVSPPMPFGQLTIGLNADHRTFRVVNGKGATDVDGVTTPISGTSFHRFNPIGPTGVTLAGNGVSGTQNGFLINGNRVTGGGDIVFDFYPFIIKGEYAYASQERDALGAGGANLDDLIIQGGYGSIGYWIFGNKRNGLLANGRYEHLRVDDRRNEFSAPVGAPKEKPVELRSGTLGLSWFVNPSVRVRANYLLTDLRPGRNAIGLSNNTIGELAHQGIAEVQIQF